MHAAKPASLWSDDGDAASDTAVDSGVTAVLAYRCAWAVRAEHAAAALMRPSRGGPGTADGDTAAGAAGTCRRPVAAPPSLSVSLKALCARERGAASSGAGPGICVDLHTRCLHQCGRGVLCLHRICD